MKFLSGLQTKTGNPENAISRATAGSVAYSFGGTYTPRNWDFDKSIAHGYEKLISIYRCIDAISINYANRQKYVQQGSPRHGEGRRTADPQLEYVLNTRANPYETSWQFHYRLSSQALLSRKGVFVEVVPNAEGRPAQFHLLNPTNVEPIRDPEGKQFVLRYDVKQADGRIVPMDPKQIRWIKLKPHPADPYQQMTPLVAAGIVADTEWLARVFNRATVANNGRASQIIMLNAETNPETAAEIKSMVEGNGPGSAGRTIVLDGDGVDSVQLSATPSDLQYLAGLEATKNDIYIAFGTPESVLGNASGRTYDNADAERLNWWMDTEGPHCDALVAGFDADTSSDGLHDDLFVVNNYDDVDVLQRARAAKQTALMNEVMQGVRTLDSYLVETGQKPSGTPEGRVFWFGATGKLPIGDPNDVQEAIKVMLQAATPPTPGMTPDQQMQASQQGAQQGAQLAYTDAQRQIANDTSARALRLVGKALDALTEAKQIPVAETKSIEPTDEEDDEDYIDVEPEAVVEVSSVKSCPRDNLRVAVESESFGLMTAWNIQQEKAALDRIMHAKARQGTRHWEGEGRGTKALNTSYVIDAHRWASDLAGTMEPLIRNTVEKQFKSTLREMQAEGVIDALLKRGGGNRAGRTLGEKAFASESNLNSVKQALVTEIKGIVSTAAHNQSQRLLDRISEMDTDGKSMNQIQATIRKMTGKRSVWQKQLSTYVTTSLLEGAVEQALSPVADMVEKTWNHHPYEDEARARPTHLEADGQTVPASKQFRIGDTYMTRPADPTAPIAETAQCKCWLTWAPKEGVLGS